MSTGRVALIHDFLVDLRGAERVFLELANMWPEADILTTVYDENGTEGRFAHRSVKASFLQKLRPTARTFRGLLPFYPAAIQSLDLSGYDLVISSSSAWAHAVRCPPDSVHVSYCYNPFRYAWNEREQTLAARDPISRALLRELFERWRHWDRSAARRTTRYIACSRVAQGRIREYYRRESNIVYPAVRTERFSRRPVAQHYTCVGELVSHKQLDVAVEAFNTLRRPLIIVGDGPEYRRLRRMAGPTIRFAGRLSDAALVEVIASARALVMTSVEEFGITAIEAQAAGRPVIARGEGGALETIRPGVTGIHWAGGPWNLASAVASFDDAAIDPAACIAQADRFNVATFRHGIRTEVQAALGTPNHRDIPLNGWSSSRSSVGSVGGERSRADSDISL